MSPRERLENILWEEVLRGSIPFGATNRMLCLSESPPDHLRWLLGERRFPAWALLFDRDWVYNLEGGPVWYARPQQYSSLDADQRDWAVPLDADRSDWLHEREWRIRVPQDAPGLQVQPGDVRAIIVADPDWAPWRLVPVRTGWLLDADGLPGIEGVDYEVREEWRLPRLWSSSPRYLWDNASRHFRPLPIG